MSEMSVLGEALRRRDSIDCSKHLMPRGKYKGRPLADIPSDYLRWALNNWRECHQDRWQINEELKRRIDPPEGALEMSRITSTALILLMHRNHRGTEVARRLIVTDGGYDWEGRPDVPIDPGCYIGDGSQSYYSAHPWEKPPAELATFEAARRLFESYPRDWPPIPARAVRQAIVRGWLEQEGSVLSVTPAGRDHWHCTRYGRPEGSTPPRSSRKRRPKGERKMFSAYRWKVQGRNRHGSTPQPAPHHAIHRHTARTAAYEAHLAAGGDPDDFAWQPPEETQEGPPRRQERAHARRRRP